MKLACLVLITSIATVPAFAQSEPSSSPSVEGVEARCNLDKGAIFSGIGPALTNLGNAQLAVEALKSQLASAQKQIEDLKRQIALKK